MYKTKIRILISASIVSLYRKKMFFSKHTQNILIRKKINFIRNNNIKKIYISSGPECTIETKKKYI